MRGTTNSLYCSGQWWLRCWVWCFTLQAMTLGSPVSTSGTKNDNYSSQRSLFIANEFHDSLGGKLNLDSDESAANKILMAAKQKEVDTGFKNSTRFLPSRNFITAVKEIQRSKTFKIIHKMPKGAVLHLHDTTIVSGKYVYENITFRKNLHVCRGKDGSITDYRFLQSPDKDTSCTSSAGWELLADLRANKAIAKDVNEKVRASLTMVVPDPAAAYPNLDAAWVRAVVAFTRLLQLITYRPVFIDYYYQGLTEMRKDNVMYIEIRAALPTLYDLDGKTYGPVDVAGLYKTTTERFVKDHPDFVGAKLIYTPLRLVTAKTFDQYMVNIRALKKKYPEFVAGFDLAGQEDKGEPLIRFADKLRTLPPNIKLFLHAGETQWNGLSTDENLIDAVLLNTTRIGHGFALAKHPRVMELVKKRGIAVEVNPISSQIGTMASDMRNHPASVLFARDFPVVVSSDDPGLWGAVGLSYDFYEAFVGIMSRSADIRALKQLAINSIKYSAMSDEEKTRAYSIWKAKWAQFISNVVKDNSAVSN